MDSPLELRPQIRDSYLGLCFGPASLLEPLSSLLALDEPSLTPPAQGLPTPVTGPLWKGTGTAGGPSAGPEAGEAPARRLFAFQERHILSSPELCQEETDCGPIPP